MTSFFYDDDDGGGDNGDDVDADDDDNADDASYLSVRHEGAVKLSVVAANPVELGAVHRLVLLCADECVVKDKPLGVLLVAGYHLKLDTIQVLVRDAEFLFPLAASHPHNQGNEAETIEEHCSALCASDGLTMVKQIY